jgi:hypothetical protein
LTLHHQRPQRTSPRKSFRPVSTSTVPRLYESTPTFFAYPSRARTCAQLYFLSMNATVGQEKKDETSSKISRRSLRPYHPVKSRQRSPHLRRTRPSRRPSQPPPAPRIRFLPPSGAPIHRRSLAALARPSHHHALFWHPVRNHHLAPRPRLRFFRSAQPQSSVRPRKRYRGNRPARLYRRRNAQRRPRPRPPQRKRPPGQSHQQIRDPLFHATSTRRGGPTDLNR